mmetsp:Transcript_9672/g.35886  ORF Transcript_9672/g.35886 Transcript_9672/m.35886 type:complete len:578 (-) Transcript_9672:1394-3127(-)|eukprot:CAMPEP_0117447382 /NCGR_PEP_ID=MMETSP0759-20121206/6846_1 /TAXON_ID=63605 /ORGANISM="Percolomonas cosmopolitus, Strain WS" /LENGTH=577 /DNA_ID=CAMNT_0005239715 /DNA_START=93 /DNA_END=1826 /DNA_ORIENTATION=-
MNTSQNYDPFSSSTPNPPKNKSRDSINGASTSSSTSTPIFNSYQRNRYIPDYSDGSMTPGGSAAKNRGNLDATSSNVRVMHKESFVGKLLRRNKTKANVPPPSALYNSSLGGKTSDYLANHSDDDDDERVGEPLRISNGNNDEGDPSVEFSLKTLAARLLKFMLENSFLYVLTFVMVMARSIDFVFFVRLAYKMRNFEFILSGIILSFAFNLITWPIVFFRIYVTGQITPEMRKFPKRKFFFMGLMDSLNVIVTTIPAALVSGVVNVVMAQSVILLNVITSYVFLNYRFGLAHGLGLLVLCAGIVVAIYPLFLDDDVAGPLGPFATAIFVFLLFIGNLPMAASNCYKELYLKEADLDVFYMNGWVALWQFLLGIALFPMVFIPLPGGAPYVKPAEFGQYFVNGMKCFAGINSQTVLTGAPLNSTDACPGTWMVFLVFIGFNMAYNLLILAVMKRGSSTLAVVASTARLALSNFLFLVRPIAGSSTIPSLSINDIISLILLIFGILFYGARPEKQATPADKVYQVKQKILRTFCFCFYKEKKPQRSDENNILADSDTDNSFVASPGDFGLQHDDVRPY